jgi:alpha-ketoglutarate-dependent taurine dioxygenase
MEPVQVGEPSEAFGIAEVTGLDPADPAVPGDELRSALARHAVLCIRLPRRLDDEELRAVARLLGPIKDPVGRTRDGEQLRYSEMRQAVDSGFVMTDEVRAKLGEVSFGGLDDQRPGLFETFHCDDTFTEKPAWATVLHARSLPPSGGGPTVFMDMRAAFERLEPSMKERLEGLRVAYAHNNEDAFPPRRAATGPADALVRVSHPLVRTHPLTATRALFLDLDRATHIENMPIAEGRALLEQLQDLAESHAPRCSHDWQDHDVLVWDNSSVQHKAGGNFPVGEPRRFWRYMISGDVPA